MKNLNKFVIFTIILTLTACGGSSEESESSIPSAPSLTSHCSEKNVYTKTYEQGFEHYEFTTNNCNNLVSLSIRVNGTKPNNVSNILSIDTDGINYYSNRSGSFYNTDVYVVNGNVVKTYSYKLNGIDMIVDEKVYEGPERNTIVQQESYYVYESEVEFQKVKTATDPYLIYEQLDEALLKAPKP